MGTRARINIFNGNQILVSIYRQFDGYPSGLGVQIADFAKDMTIVNGIGSQEAGKAANGMGCFAAQLIAKLKTEIGNLYIRDTSPDSQGEEFIYNLHDKGGRIWIDVLSGRMTMFGNPGNEESEMKAIFSDFADAYAGL